MDSLMLLAVVEDGAIIIRFIPDYQYTLQLIPAMAVLVERGLYPRVLGSRIFGGGAPFEGRASISYSH